MTAHYRLNGGIRIAIITGNFGYECDSEDSEGLSPTEREFDRATQKGRRQTGRGTYYVIRRRSLQEPDINPTNGTRRNILHAERERTHEGFKGLKGEGP